MKVKIIDLKKKFKRKKVSFAILIAPLFFIFIFNNVFGNEFFGTQIKREIYLEDEKGDEKFLKMLRE